MDNGNEFKTVIKQEKFVADKVNSTARCFVQCNYLRQIVYKHVSTGLGVLTLRRLMSYIYMEHPFLMFLDHTQRRSTVGRTPLDE